MSISTDHSAEGVRVLQAESQILAQTAEQLDTDSFNRAVDLLLKTESHVVVTGIGKSGHVGKKISATLASTGTPAFFLHPAEALHGDLGMLTERDAVIALSNSGNSEELLNLLPYIKRHDVQLIVITSAVDSKLAKAADVLLTYPLAGEACPLNLAPTASTAAQMALGDALSGALIKARGFTQDDFAIRHPLGTLGRRLLMLVSDLMLPREESPILHDSATLQEAIDRMMGLGAVALENESKKLTGIFTNEDLRKMLARGGFDQHLKMHEIMTKTPRHIRADVLGSKAVEIFEVPKRVSVLPVVDQENHLVGMLHLHHLIQAGIA